jgi:hypothetical protein
MKSYLEKNNLHYFMLSPNSGKPIRAVICHLPLDMPANNISNSSENFQRTNPCGIPPLIPCYLNKKHNYHQGRVIQSSDWPTEQTKALSCAVVIVI